MDNELSSALVALANAWMPANYRVRGRNNVLNGVSALLAEGVEAMKAIKQAANAVTAAANRFEGQRRVIEIPQD